MPSRSSVLYVSLDASNTTNSKCEKKLFATNAAYVSHTMLIHSVWIHAIGTECEKGAFVHLNAKMDFVPYQHWMYQRRNPTKPMRRSDINDTHSSTHWSNCHEPFQENPASLTTSKERTINELLHICQTVNSHHSQGDHIQNFYLILIYRESIGRNSAQCFVSKQFYATLYDDNNESFFRSFHFCNMILQER